MEIWETPLITRFLLSLVNLKEKHVHDICLRNKGKPYVISGTMPSNIPSSILKIKQWAIIRLLWLLLVLFGPFPWQLDYQSFLDSSKIDFQTLHCVKPFSSIIIDIQGVPTSFTSKVLVKISNLREIRILKISVKKFVKLKWDLHHLARM